MSQNIKANRVVVDSSSSSKWMKTPRRQQSHSQSALCSSPRFQQKFLQYVQELVARLAWQLVFQSSRLVLRVASGIDLGPQLLRATGGLSYNPLTWSDSGIDIPVDWPPSVTRDHRLTMLPVDYCFTDPGGGSLVDLSVPTEPSLLNADGGHSVQIVDYKQTSVHFSTDFRRGAQPKSTTQIVQQECLCINPGMGLGLHFSEVPV
uniref:Uncharacterized protein n=1 Tax=Sphaerodactylus townsendi TaxID=933632 RepID=A0ACB8G3J7_9SAUR